jgi:hypothetical protein
MIQHYLEFCISQLPPELYDLLSRKQYDMSFDIAGFSVRPYAWGWDFYPIFDEAVGVESVYPQLTALFKKHGNIMFARFDGDASVSSMLPEFDPK